MSKVVRHQAPCVNRASAYGQQISVFVVLERQIRKDIHKPMAILIVVEDSLTVYPSHHHMVDAIAAFLPHTPRHGVLLHRSPYIVLVTLHISNDFRGIILRLVHE